ncbi:MAG: LCP family protein [Spirochaetaceae bacterium]
MRGNFFAQRGGVFLHPAAIIAIVLLFVVGVGLIAFHVRISALEDRVAMAMEGEAASESNSSDGDGEGTGAAQANADGDASGDIYEAAVTGLEELLEHRNAAAAGSLFERLLDPENPASILSGSGLRRRDEGELQASLLSGDRRYFRVDGDAPRGTVEIESRLDESITVSDIEDDGAAAREFVREQTERLDTIMETEERMRRELESLPRHESIAAALDSRDMRPTRIVRDGFVLRRGLANEGGAVIARIAADAEENEYSLDGETLDGGPQELRAAVEEAIRGYDPEEELRRVREELEKRLETMVSDGGFATYLEERGLETREISSAGDGSDRTKERREHYELLDIEEREPIGHLVVDAAAGTVELVGVDGELTHTLDRVAVTHGLSEDTEPSDDHPAFLLLGVHDELTDSIMYVRPGDEEISIVSIPRDIYDEGRKLNEVHASYGPQAMIEHIERLLGIEIDHYISIDMDAFSEVVDALGRVPVEIDREFLDPTTSYRADGERRMLYFPPGEHELNSDAALKFARSRKTSSDFGRARRQQLLLGGIRDRVDQLALSDADTLFDLIRVGLEHTDTDMGFLETLQYYRRYRDVEEMRRLVLSTDNVFYSTYSELYEEGREPEAAEDYAGDRGSWILRPRDENWEGVQGFLREWLTGSKPEPEDYFETEGDAETEQVDVEALEALTDVASEP